MCSCCFVCCMTNLFVVLQCQIRGLKARLLMSWPDTDFSVVRQMSSALNVLCKQALPKLLGLDFITAGKSTVGKKIQADSELYMWDLPYLLKTIIYLYPTAVRAYLLCLAESSKRNLELLNGSEGPDFKAWLSRCMRLLCPSYWLIATSSSKEKAWCRRTDTHRDTYSCNYEWWGMLIHWSWAFQLHLYGI